MKEKKNQKCLSENKTPLRLLRLLIHRVDECCYVLVFFCFATNILQKIWTNQRNI